MNDTRKQISVGVTVGERGSATIGETLRSLSSANFTSPRLFVDGQLSVPEGYEVSRRQSKIGGWPNFLLGLNELILRDPTVDGYLMVQDDVVFNRRVKDYFDHLRVPEDAGVISFFSPAVYNARFGWNRVATGWGFAGAQALYFPAPMARVFVGSLFVTSYRSSPPRTTSFSQDGKFHIDAVVGEWCRQSRKSIYVHNPSLSQHIGVSSAMYANHHTNIANRYADDFPGEDIDANHTYVGYQNHLAEWARAGQRISDVISPAVWALILQSTKKGSQSLEFSVGLSTRLFTEAQLEHVCFESDNEAANNFFVNFPKAKVQIVESKLTDDGWVKRNRSKFKVVYLGKHSFAENALDSIKKLSELVSPHGRIFVEGANSNSQLALATILSETLEWDVFVSSGGNDGYAIVESAETIARPPLWKQ